MLWATMGYHDLPRSVSPQTIKRSIYHHGLCPHRPFNNNTATMVCVLTDHSTFYFIAQNDFSVLIHSGFKPH
ncbi:hypothetical protein, partial [Rhodonellum psychrophilum]